MSPGPQSREDNGLARVVGTSPHVRENAPHGAQVREPLYGRPLSPHRPGDAAPKTEMDAFGSKYNIPDAVGPGDEPPGARTNEEGSRSLAETEVPVAEDG